MVTAVRMRVPAKVNLFLAVRGRRPDGMHEIASVMHTVGLFDEITARLEGRLGVCFHPASRRAMDIVFEHDAGAALPDDASNLAVRAARLLASRIGVGGAGDAGGSGPRTASAPRAPEATPDASPQAPPATYLRLDKRIPVAAGLGGGSADAAATLAALDLLWNAELSRDEMRTLAAELGADVPFCVTGGTALATGTGVTTAQVLARGNYWWVVGISDEGLETATVYRTWDEVGSPSRVEPDAVLHALRTGDEEALGAALHNDLDQAVFHLRPELDGAREAMLAAGALGAVVTGSGPTLVALAVDEPHARSIAATVRGRFDRVEIARSPAAGPALLDPPR